MTVIGLTGGIGMGKSTVAAQLAALGAKICNADAIVHMLLGKGGAAAAEVERAFPGAVNDGGVDRKALGDIVFHDAKQLAKLERLLHPLVVAEENRFIGNERRKGAKLIVLDIPLLFETAAERRCDVTIVASAPAFLQRQRVMKRPGMTAEKFLRIVSAQMPEREKRKRADNVVLTGLGKGASFRTLASWLKGL
ncbi:MAG: dephospho-CoA kinase [Pseudomonadota bacterium]|nr:dephospho-CoA kinase [Pseudomonadota bacterium]MDE3038351.1 dephospho-CoA kinase [Pseudomonadota bacterium]